LIEYQKLAPACDLAICSLEEAALITGPAFVYELHVAPYAILHARNLLKVFAADTKEHPLAPYIDLIEDMTLRRYEWVLCANGKCAGSIGVW
jgi:hypothetical protein